MNIETENFPELCQQFDLERGAYPEFPNATAARVAFARAMHLHGYRRGPGRVWLKEKAAAVMEP